MCMCFWSPKVYGILLARRLGREDAPHSPFKPGVPPHAAPQVRCPSLGDWSLCLYIRWTTLCGDSKVTRLPLRLISSIEQLQGLFRCVLGLR